MPSVPGDPKFLAIARLVAPHGVRGELAADILTDFPTRFEPLQTVYVGANHRPYALQSTRPHRKRVLLKLGGVDSADLAEELRGNFVFVPLSEAVTLPHDQYYWHQIIGLAVHTVAGLPLGTIVEILRTGSNDVYVVRGARGEVLIPAIEDVVKEIDLHNGRMLVLPLPGMLD